MRRAARLQAGVCLQAVARCSHPRHEAADKGVQKLSNALLSRGGLHLQPPNARGFSGAAVAKLVKATQAEAKHEEESYEQAKEIKQFLASSPFKFVETPGDVNMALERDVDGGKVVRIEWQLTAPIPPAEGEQEQAEEPSEGTELTVTVEDKKTGAGLTFYCSTEDGEEHRYIIGSVKAYASAQEKESVSSYNGPDFDDLDDKLQEAFDEYLAELGMSSEVCDFVDGMAVDKEQREYVRWLQSTRKFLEA